MYIAYIYLYAPTNNARYILEVVLEDVVKSIIKYRPIYLFCQHYEYN